jgi:undecaprenyl pyrophosphate phosphatase UppP
MRSALVLAQAAVRVSRERAARFSVVIAEPVIIAACVPDRSSTFSSRSAPKQSPLLAAQQTLIRRSG